ncbi:40S ribosomal protein S10-2-like [Hibiscus syriacus]|uniref:40S ribosomal protein S10-2-like n=1 Tax=Hibiscus syriacus TaxID=106335 RepID=UPI001922F847|nr:40S ribosomal protein S10-2-like [Hibiscus syriacus]
MIRSDVRSPSTFFKRVFAMQTNITILAKHPEIDVPNLQVIKLMQSFKSKEYVRETFAWMHYYWYLTNDGIEFLRTYLNLPSEIVPATLKKQAKPDGRPMGSPRDRPHGPPRFGDGERRFGDRDGYRGGPRGGGDFGDKEEFLLTISLHSGVLEQGLPLVEEVAVMVMLGLPAVQVFLEME